MPPEQQGLPISTTSNQTLDPQAVDLAKAIRSVETQGTSNPFVAKGKSGEYGAYQFTPDTWNKLSQKYGVSAPLENTTPQQQNEVAYKQIKEWKDKGFNVGQIASMWNAGEGAPNAYQDPTFQGINKSGVHFDVPAYAKSVATAYQTIKSGRQPTGITSPSTVPQQTTQTPQEKGFFENLFSGNFGAAMNQAVDFAFPIVPDIADVVHGKSTKTPLQVLGDAGLSALWFVPGLGLAEKGAQLGTEIAAEGATGLVPRLLGSKLAMGALEGGAIGYGADVASKLSQGKTDIGQILTPGVGTLIGAPLGGIGAKVGEYLDTLPNKITRGAFKIDPETAQYALDTKPIGRVSSLLKESQLASDNLGKQIDDILSTKYAGAVGNGNNSLIETIKAFPNSNLYDISNVATKGVQGVFDEGINNVAEAVKNVAPLQTKLVDKVVDGTATLAEKNELRSALDRTLYLESGKLSKLSTADKAITNKFMNELRNEVQTSAPETAPLFYQWSKEIGLKKALLKIAKRAPSNLITFRDLLGAGIGGGLAGIPGALSMLGIEKLSTTPGGQFAIAKAIRGLIPIGEKAGTLGGVAGIRGLVGP